MNYSRAFSYVFEDKNWLSKILIAGLISLIPIIGQLYLFGWMVEIIRRVKANRTDIIPTTHFSYFLTLGLKLFVVSLIYSIPAIIFTCILNLITGAAGSSESGDFARAFLTGLGCIGSLISIVLSLAISLLGTYGAIKLAETDQIKACLDFNDAFNCIKANLSAFIIVELLAIVAGLIQSAGLIICVVGVIFSAPYGIAIIGNLVGQLWDNLKPWDKPTKPYRGSANTASADIIEEAPFTKVQDIEKAVENAEDYSANVSDEIEKTAEETIEDVSDKAENIVEDVKDGAEAVSADVQDTVNDVTEEAQNIVADAEEKIQYTVDGASETFQKVVETDAPSANTLEETASDISESAPAAETPSETNDGSETIPPFE